MSVDLLPVVRPARASWNKGRIVGQLHRGIRKTTPGRNGPKARDGVCPASVPSPRAADQCTNPFAVDHSCQGEGSRE